MKNKDGEGTRGEPNLNDVARLAGVSPASVSRVLNGVGPISDRLRESVENAAKNLGYRPRNQKVSSISPTLVVFASNLFNPLFTEIIAGIDDRASTHGLSTVLADLHGGLTPWEPIRDAMHHRQSCGHIVLGTVLSETALLDLALHGKVPLVVVNHLIKHPAIRSINIDHAKASYAATSHLLNLRHRKIVFICGSITSNITSTKISGVEGALRDSGLELPPINIIDGDSTIEWGFQAAKSLLGRPEESRPTAILCSCDLIAFGVLHAVRMSGLSVPRHISVVGFDDITMACHSNPALTTISPPKYEMGRLAVDLLLSRGRGSSQITDYTMLESPLVIRESTAECPDSSN